MEPYIEDCLQSVMRQTYRGEMECILVDDCGTDNSMEIVQQLVAAYKGPVVFKIVHHDHNRGLSAARNTGIDVSSGEYVFFLDSDDWISDGCIERLTQPLGLEQYDAIRILEKTEGRTGEDDMWMKFSYYRQEKSAL